MAKGNQQVAGAGGTSAADKLGKFRTNDSSRDRTILLFYDVFMCMIENADAARAVQLAAELEREIRERRIPPAQIRSKYLNLKDRDNELCSNVYDGKVSIQEFVMMSIEQMKSREQRINDEKLVESGKMDAQLPQMEEETDIFLCYKCNQRKCRYRQLQTRSADEPMTTYVFCKCGNTWKF